MEAPRQRCIVFVPADQASAGGAPIFGLQLAERTVLAFLRAGVRDFLLVGEPELAHQVAGTLASRRLRQARVQVLSPGAASAGAGARRLLPGTLRSPLRPAPDRPLVAETRLERHRGGGGSGGCPAEPEGAARIASWASRAAMQARRACGRRGRAAAPPGSCGPPGGSLFARAFEDPSPEYRSPENALSLLARREPVATWAVAELWQAVRAEPDAHAADLVLARRKVLGGAVGVDDGVVARYLNRPISRRISARLLSRDVRPWQVSLLCFMGTVGAGTAFAMGHPAMGGMIAQLAAVLDGVDGEIARIRYQDSPFGGVYDALLDRIGDAVLIGGMTLYAWLMGAGHSAVALGFGAVAGSSLSMLVKEKYGTQFLQPWLSDREGRWRWLLLGRDGRLFLSLVAGLTGYVEAVLAYLAVGTHLHAGVRMYQIRSEAAQSSG
jgi:phosphatidylglycerophosphate synthase